jgi:DUF4097 and DUF4098 domain-containing protein YvlB
MCAIKILPIVAISALLFMTLSHHEGFSSQEQSERSTSYPSSQDGSVTVEDSSGDIEITGWDRDQVSMTEKKAASSQDDLASLSTTVSGSARSMMVAAHYPSDCDDCEIDLVLSVPRGVRVNLDTASGDITIAAMTGSVRAMSNSGDVTVERNAGPAYVQTDSGDVKIAGAGGDVEGKTASGDISASGLEADATLSSASGDVTANFGSWQRVRLVRLVTASGDIDVHVPRASAFRLDAATTSGSIDSNLHLPIDDEDSGARTSAQVGNGPAVMELHSTSGDIDLTMR